jgi:hypothetical protein
MFCQYDTQQHPVLKAGPFYKNQSRGGAVVYVLDGTEYRSSSPGEDKNINFYISRPALGSTQLTIKYVTLALSPGERLAWRGVA